MTAYHYKSDIITDAEAAQQSLANKTKVGGVVKELIESIETTASDGVGSTYRFFRVHSGWRISSLQLYSDDIGTTTIANFGLYDTTENGGAVVDADFFGSAVSLKDGAVSGTDITRESAVIDTPDADLELWDQISGLTADPNKWYDVTATLTGAADAIGTICLRLRYVDGS